MHRKFFYLLAGIVLLGQGCLADPPQPNRPILFDFFDRNETEQSYPSGNATTTVLEVPPLKPGETGSPSRTVVVSSIVAKQTLPNPFIILGRAAALQNTVYWRVRDGRGAELASGQMVTDAPAEGQFGTFRTRAFYDRVPDTDDGRVEVYTHGPGGVEQDIVSIPVKMNRALQALKMYFINQAADPELKQCDKPEAVTRRVPKTDAPAEAALRELLRGPTAAEQSSGSRTAILPGVNIRSVAIEGDTATVDFSREFVLGIAGSCNVQALRAQVEQTLKQFPNVRNVKILVEGADAEESLQP